MRRNLRSIVAAIPALLVMACALGPDYHRPETKVPAAFRFEPTATTESFADQGWWQVYQDPTRSEEHTSELQSRGHLVCRLLLEKKKKKKTNNNKIYKQNDQHLQVNKYVEGCKSMCMI